MPLKYRYKTESEIPSDLKSFYVEKDGAWILDAQGVVDADHHRQFITNNSRMMAALGAANAEDAIAKLEKMKDIDPAKYAKLMKDADDAATAKLKSEGKLEELHAQQVEALKNANQKALEVLAGEKTVLQRRLESLLVDDAIIAACTKKGVKPEAMLDAKLRGKLVFRLEGETVVAKDGDKCLFDEKGEPLTIETWLSQRLANDCKHWALPNSGGGAGGGGAGGGAGADGGNPWQPGKTFNLTKQALIMKENPALAARLKAAAGV